MKTIQNQAKKVCVSTNTVEKNSFGRQAKPSIFFNQGYTQQEYDLNNACQK